MKFYKYLAAGLCCASLALYSCGGDDDKITDEPEVPVTPVNPGDGTTASDKLYTPLESKQFLSGTAQDFLNKFRTADHQEAIAFCNDVVDQYGDLDAPDEFSVEATTGQKAPTPDTFLRKLVKGLKNADPTSIAAAAMTYTYNVNFSDFTGVYVPGRGRWVKQSESNDIVFQFTLDGQDCVVRAQADGGNSTLDFETSDEDWDWETGRWEEYVDRYKLSIPHTVKLTATRGGKQLVSATINTNIDVDGHNLSYDTYVSVANIEVSSKATGVDSGVTENTSLKVGGETLVSTKSQLNGQNLCNYDKIQDALDDGDDDAILSFVKDGVTNIDIMGKVQVYGNATLNRDVLNALDSYWDYWDWSDRSQAENDCQKACDNLNKYVTAQVCYENGATRQAEIRFQKEYDEWNGWDYTGWEYYVVPVIFFPADNTTYSFEDYTESGFAGVEDLWQNQLDNYKRLWR